MTSHRSGISISAILQPWSRRPRLSPIKRRRSRMRELRPPSWCLCALVSLCFLPVVGAAQRKPLSVIEATIPEMQKALKEKRVTSREIVQQYLTRIATYDNKLHATIIVNPNALKEADELDRERAKGKVRGPLHGIPIALKDIIHTTDMP